MRRTALITTLLLALTLTASVAEARKAPGKRHGIPSFSTKPAISPAFGRNRHDYVVRCGSSPVRFKVRVSGKWKGRVGSLPFHRRNFKAKRSMNAGSKVVVRFRGPRHRRLNFYVRCLPRDFPAYRFRRLAPGGPRLFAMQFDNHYAGIIGNDGAPVWWYQADGFPDNFQVMPDGTVAWAPVATFDLQQGAYELRNLRGRLIRTVTAANGLANDVHELIQLRNGNYLTGSFKPLSGIDASPFGGSSDATINGAEVQEVRPDGSLAWSWESSDHIDLSETGRWWDQVVPLGQPYDTVHWNSVERNGSSMLMSFRHLDAIYKIDRRTGKVIWKLGGTTTPESLKVRKDPLGNYPFGGQHDARLNSDGTISIFDNGSGLDRPPRAVRYRINEKKETATMVSSFGDPRAGGSFCCGSNRELDGGERLVGWGMVTRTAGNPFVTGEPINGLIGAYEANGDPIFRFKTPGAISYRANPVKGPDPSLRKLRNAMDWMHKHR